MQISLSDQDKLHWISLLIGSKMARHTQGFLVGYYWESRIEQHRRYRLYRIVKIYEIKSRTLISGTHPTYSVDTELL
jgi:hypothetical protein